MQCEPLKTWSPPAAADSNPTHTTLIISSRIIGTYARPSSA